jgi:RsiW-degrading membrane proteinase PrsW (M82 family)
MEYNKLLKLTIFLIPMMILGIYLTHIMIDNSSPVNIFTYVHEGENIPFDRFSINHFLFGVILAMILLLLFNLHYMDKNKDIKRKEWYIMITTFLISTIVALGFELFENMNLAITGGFRSYRDGDLNMWMDIFLHLFGTSIVIIIYKFIVIKRKNYRVITKVVRVR